MARSLLDYMSCDNQGQGKPPSNPQEVESDILSIANDLLTILGEAMESATAIFPQKPAAPKRGPLPIISGSKQSGTTLPTSVDE